MVLRGFSEWLDWERCQGRCRNNPEPFRLESERQKYLRGYLRWDRYEDERVNINTNEEGGQRIRARAERA